MVRCRGFPVERDTDSRALFGSRTRSEPQFVTPALTFDSKVVIHRRSGSRAPLSILSPQKPPNDPTAVFEPP